MRQMLAILNQPNRSRALASLRMPAAVVHGAADKMVHVSGGRATARAIPGAELLVIDGMGHDMPSELFETLTEIIRRTADRADSSNRPGLARRPHWRDYSPPAGPRSRRRRRARCAGRWSRGCTSPLCTRVASVDPDDDVVRRALDTAGAVDERVGAELLDDGDLDRQAAVRRRRPGATPRDVRRRRCRPSSSSRPPRRRARGTRRSWPGRSRRPRTIRFICGEPMKPATNRFTGRS